MRVKYYEDARNSVKETPTPCKVPSVIEITQLSFFDDDNCVIFWDTNFYKYVSTIPETAEYARDRVLSQLLERGYADLTKYGAFIYRDGKTLPDYEEGEDDEDDEEENEQ